METDLESLILDLERLQRLFRLARMDEWERKLGGTVDDLRFPNSKGAIALLTGYFGGMGSLNDVVFCAQANNIPEGYEEQAANQELAELLNRIYRTLKLYNLSAGQRQWLREKS